MDSSNVRDSGGGAISNYAPVLSSGTENRTDSREDSSADPGPVSIPEVEPEIRGEQEPEIPPLLPREQPAKLTLLLPREQKPQVPKNKAVTKTRSLGSKSVKSDAKKTAEFLKDLLPAPSDGWWDVAANGKGFLIRFRWRETGAQPTLNFPRISREQALILQGSSYAKQLMEDHLYGHLDELNRDIKRRERAGRVAAWLSLTLRNYSSFKQENAKIRIVG